jgi:hypothetical protein
MHEGLQLVITTGVLMHEGLQGTPSRYTYVVTTTGVC